MQDKTRLRYFTILIVFAISGFSGLIYQSIWSHYLKLFLGHAAYAQILVLCIFMGGMSVGAWIAARVSHRLPRLLVGYVLVELAIGVLGMLFHGAFTRFLDLAFINIIPGLESRAHIEIFKWTSAAMLILPQSVLLGMTFPLMSGGLVRLAPTHAGKSIALLYFTNCMGAAIGVLASGFVLIALVGLPGTLLTAALLNITLAGVIWVLARRSDEQVYTPPDNRTPNLAPARARHWLMLAALVTGFASFVYEIAWIRMLTLVLGSSTHSFELMLAAFISGLALGGFWIRNRIEHLSDPVRSLGILLVTMSILGALTVPAYHFTFDVVAWAMRAFTPTEGGLFGFKVVAQSVAAGLMIPVTFCAGMTLPIITYALLRSGAGESAIGRVYALNTVGCIIGAVATVIWLMPLFGTKGAILVAAATQAVLAFASVPLLSSARRRMALGALFAAAGSVFLVTVLVHPDAARLNSAVYRNGNARLSEGADVFFLRDGRTATIALTRFNTQITVATNGKPDASIEMGSGPPAPDEITMVMLGTLPLLLHPNPRKVANIGFGSGLTSHVMLLDRRIERLDSVEIEPLMVQAARMAYMPRIERVFNDPRSHIVYEDAKTHFSSAKQTYDVIVSEPSNPWVSGVATLFSDEFYHQVRRHLAEDGLLVQWLQVYETDIEVIASVMKALSPHFSDYTIFNIDDSNILIVAANAGKLSDPDWRAANEQMRAELRRVGIMGFEDLTTRRIGNKALLDPFFQSLSVPANSDYFPFVDLNAARFRFLQRDVMALPALTFLPVPLLELAWPAWYARVTEPSPAAAAGTREDLVTTAGLLVQYALAGDLARLPESLARDVVMLEVPGSACSIHGAGDAWLAAVESIAGQTSSYLPPEDLRPLWDKIKGSACYAEVGPTSKQFVDLLHAVAMRDRQQIADLGREWLTTDAARESSRRAYVLTAVAASLVGSGKPGEAAQVLTLVSHQDLGGKFDLALRVLDALVAPHLVSQS